MERIICLIIGYAFGCFQTGYIYGRTKGIDIRSFGSHNSGATNSLRVLGPRAGIVVFFGDFLKTLLPCLLTRFVFGWFSGYAVLLVLYMGFGVILGHNFPFYLGFKGGKGVASTAGLMMAVDIRVTLCCLLIFILIVFLTRYVSLGSIFVMVVLFILLTVTSEIGWYGLAGSYLTEFHILSAMISGLSIFRHRKNIVRLINGTENKLNFHSSGKE